jgi:succinoglycan biosynthesis protein ExoA
VTSQQIADGALVVIPCLNEEASIAGVVNAALKDRDRQRLLVVVADGGSRDGTRNIVAKMARTIPNVRLMDNPLRLQSAGVNLAAELFGNGYRWLVRMDAHARYPDHYVSHLVQEAEQRNVQSVVVAMHSQGRHWFQKAVALAQNSLIGAGGSPHRHHGVAGYVDHGHHALFNLAFFRALKGYNQNQSHNEDAEFDARLARAGGKLWLTRNVSVIYYPRAQADELYRQYRNYGRGRALTLLRHKTKPKLRQLLPAAVLPAALLLPFVAFSPLAALPFTLWIAACLLYGAGLGIKTRKSHGFAVALAAMIMHFAWSAGFWRGVLESQAGLALRRAQELP